MTYTCAKCGWAWKPNTAALQHGAKPVKCPNCQTRQWAEKETTKMYSEGADG